MQDDFASVAQLPIAQPIRVIHRLGQRLELLMGVKVEFTTHTAPLCSTWISSAGKSQGSHMPIAMADMVIGLRPHPSRGLPLYQSARGVRRGSLGREPFKQSRRSVHGLLPGVLTPRYRRSR